MRRARAAVRIALALALAPSPAAARELWRFGDASLALSGSVRELTAVTRGTDAGEFADAIAANPARCLPAASFSGCPAFDAIGDRTVWTSLTRLRLRFDLRATRHWSAVVTYHHELRAGVLDTFEGAIGAGLGRPGLLRAEQEITGSDRARWSHLLYRGYLFFESKHLEITLGRQRIPWGVGRLWNPIDRFDAIPPLALEGDQSVGVDAVDLRWLFSGFTFLEAVVAPARDADDSSYALRLHGVARDVDFSLVAGVFEEARTLGFDLAANLGGSAVRLEVVYSDPERSVWPVDAPAPGELDDYWQAVASVDHLFDLGTGLYALLEHLYDGNALGFGGGRAGPLLEFFGAAPPRAAPVAAPASADRFGGSRVAGFAEHQTGLQLGYDLTPEIRAELLAIFDWNGTSASFFPSLRYSPVDWLELTLAAQLFVGRRRSQFGSSEHLGFLLAEVFF